MALWRAKIFALLKKTPALQASVSSAHNTQLTHDHCKQNLVIFAKQSYCLVKILGNNRRKQLTHLRSSLAFSTVITLLALLNNREVQNWSPNAGCKRNYSFKQANRHSRIEK